MNFEHLRGMQPRELEERRRDVDDQLRELHQDEHGNPRNLTRQEQADFDFLLSERDAIDRQLEQHRRIAGAFRSGHYQAPFGARGPEAASGWTDPESGREIRVLGPDERMSSLPAHDASDSPVSWGRYMRGVVTGDWRHAQAERAMSEGTLGAGGYLVPTPLSDQVIDKARNAAVIMRAGAVTVPMDTSSLAMARITGDPTPGWHTEAAAISASDMSFDRVVLQARTLVAICQLSVELAEDAANADQVITDTLAKVLALELDRAALMGDGTSGSPTGIRNQPNVGVDTTLFGANGSAISGTTPTGAVAWDWLSKTIYTVRGLNEAPNAAIMSERTAGELDLLRASTGEPLQPPRSVAALDRGILTTNAVPNTLVQGTSNAASVAFVGDFSKVMIGMRRQLQLEVSRTATVAATSMFSTLQVAIRAYMRCDVQLQRPAAFRAVLGIN